MIVGAGAETSPPTPRADAELQKLAAFVQLNPNAAMELNAEANSWISSRDLISTRYSRFPRPNSLAPFNNPRTDLMMASDMSRLRRRETKKTVPKIRKIRFKS